MASLSVADLGPVNACVPKHAAPRAQTVKASSVRRVPRVPRVTRAKRVKPRLPPIGGAKLNLAPAAAQQVRAQAAPAPRLRSAAPADAAAGEATAPVDPSSLRGRILWFFGALKTRPGAHGAVEDR